MTEYLKLVEKISSNSDEGNIIILEMENDIINESHITNPSKKDEDLLKGMNAKELNSFIEGNTNFEYDVFELSESEYKIQLNKINIGKVRSQLKSQHTDPLEKKENRLKRAESKLKNRNRLVKDEKTEQKKLTTQDFLKARTAEYKKILTKQR